MKSGGQYQVVIGNHVPQVYADACEAPVSAAMLSLSRKQREEKEHMSPLDAYRPDLGDLPAHTWRTLCGRHDQRLQRTVRRDGSVLGTGGEYLMFNAVGDALFRFLPILLGYTSAKKFNVKPFVGMLIGAALCYPTIQLSTVSSGAEPLYTLFAGTFFASPVYFTFRNSGYRDELHIDSHSGHSGMLLLHISRNGSRISFRKSSETSWFRCARRSALWFWALS